MPPELDEASDLCVSIQQLLESRHETDPADINFVQPLVQLIQRLFVVDLERAMEHGMDVLLWSTTKQLVDRSRAERERGADSNLENVISLCISWFCDLILKVCCKYRLPPLDIPSFVCLSPALREEQAMVPPPAVGNAFLAFLCLRLGDLFRYKGSYDLCSRLYRCSLRASPSHGDPWNQLGVLATLKAKPLDCLYFNVRALHCPVPFGPAASNISSLFRMYASKELREGDCFPDQYLSILARCHFLLPVPDGAVERIGPQLTKRKLLVAPLSLLQPLGAAQDEQRIRNVLTHLLTLAFNKISELLLSDAYLRPDLLLCIVLLLRVPAVCRYDQRLVEALSKSQQDVIFDNEKVETFRCFCESDPFEYPVSYGQIADHLTELSEEGEAVKVSNASLRHRRRRTVLCAPQPQQQ
ncbi:hypothetical protein Q1695_006374 [Nippostrongylus brasiliensis]|nr:hypothetical protein Q1695_006374 [Nippostrongylus brasiliensis]